MKERRAKSSAFGFCIGVILIVYGIATIAGYDVLENLSPKWVVGLTGLIFGALLLVWATSERWNFVGGETVSMVVGVIVALVVISSFVRENERRQTAAAKTVAAVSGKHETPKTTH